MSDIAVVEITSSTQESAPAETQAQKTEQKPAGRWVRSRQCFCPDNEPTDCRFHSPEEPGWETCPWEKRAGRKPGRWLWAAFEGHVPVSEEELSVGAEIKDLSKTQRNAGDKFLR